MIHELTLDTIKHLQGGAIAEAWQQELRKLVLDCEDRPGVKKPREIKLTITVVPEVGEAGGLESVDLDFHVEHKVPKRQSRSFNLDVRKSKDGQQLVFNDLSPDDAGQRTIDEFAVEPEQDEY